MNENRNIEMTVEAIKQLAAVHGVVVTRDARSGKSASRYISLEPISGAGFDAPKSTRRRFCAETGASFPRFVGFNVRVSDHVDHGDGTTVHLGVRVDLDVAGDLARLDAALAILTESVA